MRCKAVMCRTVSRLSEDELSWVHNPGNVFAEQACSFAYLFFFSSALLYVPTIYIYIRAVYSPSAASVSPLCTLLSCFTVPGSSRFLRQLLPSRSEVTKTGVVSPVGWDKTQSKPLPPSRLIMQRRHAASTRLIQAPESPAVRRRPRVEAFLALCFGPLSFLWARNMKLRSSLPQKEFPLYPLRAARKGPPHKGVMINIPGSTCQGRSYPCVCVCVWRIEWGLWDGASKQEKDWWSKSQTERVRHQRNSAAPLEINVGDALWII